MSELIYDQKIPRTQNKPYIKPLTYVRAKIFETKISGRNFYGQPFWGYGGMFPGSIAPQSGPSGIAYRNAHNKALNKLNDELGVAQGFFEAWYEREAAISLIESSAKKLVYFAKNYKKPRKMLKLFGKKMKGTKPVNLPEAWIGYHFGVKPLVSDIHAAVNILNRQFPSAVVTGSSGYHDAQLNKVTKGNRDIYCEYDYTGIVKHGITVYGINPNMDLAARIGLDKPITSVYAVIPFSWAVDYFFNVGELLSNMEPRYPGLKTRDQFTTHFIEAYSNSWVVYRDTQEIEFHGSQEGIYMRRLLPRTHTFIPTMNLKPLNPQRSSYLLSVAAIIMSGKSKK